MKSSLLNLFSMLQLTRPLLSSRSPFSTFWRQLESKFLLWLQIFEKRRVCFFDERHSHKIPGVARTLWYLPWETHFSLPKLAATGMQALQIQIKSLPYLAKIDVSRTINVRGNARILNHKEVLWFYKPFDLSIIRFSYWSFAFVSQN